MRDDGQQSIHELVMHLLCFVHGGTSMNLSPRICMLIPFVEPSSSFLMQIRFVSQPGTSHEEYAVTLPATFMLERTPYPDDTRISKSRHKLVSGGSLLVDSLIDSLHDTFPESNCE